MRYFLRMASHIRRKNAEKEMGKLRTCLAMTDKFAEWNTPNAVECRTADQLKHLCECEKSFLHSPKILSA